MLLFSSLLELLLQSQPFFSFHFYFFLLFPGQGTDVPGACLLACSAGVFLVHRGNTREWLGRLGLDQWQKCLLGAPHLLPIGNPPLKTPAKDKMALVNHPTAWSTQLPCVPALLTLLFSWGKLVVAVLLVR